VTERETMEYIARRGNCFGVKCRNCTLDKDGACHKGSTAEIEARKWLVSHKEEPMDKKEAIKRLDALDAEAKRSYVERAELRKIIEKPEKLEYDESKLYVAMFRGEPHILAGQDSQKYFRWHSFDGELPSSRAWSANHNTADDAIKYANEHAEKITAFSDPREGLEYFMAHYK